MYGTLGNLTMLRWYPGSGTRARSLADELIGIAVHQVTHDVTVVQVCGEVDLLTAPVLQAEVDKQLKPPPPTLIIDLTGVTFFGASGVSVLLEAHDRTTRCATSLRLVHCTRAVARPLDLLRLSCVFQTYSVLAAALFDA